jgi:hypothetical protein
MSSRHQEPNTSKACIVRRKACCLASLLTSLALGCSSDDANPEPRWNCAVVAMQFSDICICGETAEPDQGSGECPAQLSCCSLGRTENGGRRCVCLPGGGTCERGAREQAVDTCPP